MTMFAPPANGVMVKAVELAVGFSIQKSIFFALSLHALYQEFCHGSNITVQYINGDIMTSHMSNIKKFIFSFF